MTEESAKSPEGRTESKLVDAEGLLESLFEPRARPSLRWIRQMQSQRTIPYLKIGHLVFFDVDEVRRSLAKNCQINGR